VTRNIADEPEILTTGYVDQPDAESLEPDTVRIAAQEARRHDRVADVVEQLVLQRIRKISDAFDISSDATVAAGRPSVT
jgi:hypothetical protein